MYAYIVGKITFKTPTFVYLENNGIGYHLNISLYTFSKIENKTDVKLYTYLQVREDDMSLYGFFDENEKLLFEKLISVSGIGATTAQIILSSMSPAEIITAIVNEDDMSLKRVKGIGAKTAKRVILDLKDKVAKMNVDQSSGIQAKAVSPVKDEALAALMALGVNKAKAELVLSKVIKANPGLDHVEDLIKLALKQM
ncbi:MAG TPA: Holliday junction branch migration protein RuvA [Bacteroidetes bacterium]|nr:Holliday junction branch migration protein RuvA [Bacteroidota bacterium]